MSMSLAALEILEQAQFPPAQARAIARLFEVESAARNEQFATKSDLDQLESRLEARFDLKLGELRSQLGVQIVGVRTECMRWTFLTMIGQVGLLTGIMYFLLQNLR